MHEGCSVELREKKAFLMDEELSRKVFDCKIKKYNENDDEICLLLNNAQLPKSLWMLNTNAESGERKE